MTLELVAFPLPGEATMAYCGFLVYQGKLNLALSIITASLGVITGVTISYMAGHFLGKKFFERFGGFIHLGPDKLEKTSIWFERYGRRLLLITYFIPGIRHITGYLSGLTGISFKKFAARAYIGAVIWTGTFISLGRILGPDWEKFYGPAKKYLVLGIILALTIAVAFYLFKSFKPQIMGFIFKSLYYSVKVFHTMGKIKVALIFVCLAFIGLSALVIGMIQDLLANEFVQFDNTVSLLVRLIFTNGWSVVMRAFGSTTSLIAVSSVCVLLVVWILTKGSDKLLEITYLLIAVFGGEVLNLGLEFVFHRTGPLGLSISGYTFPSRQSFMAVTSYGFLIFLILRYSKRHWPNSIITVLSAVICLFTGLAPLYNHLQYPSDVAAGYVFGGVWLSLNIILLELFRILPEIQAAPDKFR